MPAVQYLSIPALVIDGVAHLLKCNGKVFKTIPLDDVGGTLDESMVTARITRPEWFAWTHSVDREWHRAKVQDPWERKAENLAGAWRLRSLDNRRGKAGRYFTPASRATWNDAAMCMYFQLNNRRRIDRMGPWGTWARTVARNQERRMAIKDERRKGNSGCDSGVA